MANWNSFTCPYGAFEAMIAVNGKLYCFRNPVTNDGAIFAYDIHNESWEHLGTTPPGGYLWEARIHLAAWNNTIQATSIGVTPNNYRYQVSIAEFDTETNSWTRATNFSEPVFVGYGSGVVDDTLYVAGVQIVDDETINNRILELNLQTRAYNFITVEQAQKEGWMYSHGAATDEAFYFAALWSEYSYKYDVDSQNVSPIQNVPLPSVYGNGFYYNNKIYFSGYSNTASLNPEENYWRVEIEHPASAAGATQYGGILYIFTSSGVIYSLDISPETVLSITNAQPSGGFVNEKEDSRFEWSLIDSNGDPCAQQSAVFEWREGTSGTIHQINVDAQQYATIPADTFPNGTIQWRVMATGANGVETPYSEWFTLTTIDQTPLPPTNLNPSSGAHDGTQAIAFTWRHNSPLSTPQSAFDLEFTYNNGESFEGRVSQTTSSQLYVAPANSISPTDPTGKIGWRVRTYNSDGDASGWSEPAWFIVEAHPDAPEWVSVQTDSSFPLCRWISPAQIAYQLQVVSSVGEVLHYDSGTIHGRDTHHKLTKPVHDGAYIFRVRVTNSRGRESDWGEITVNIITEKKLKIILSGEPIANGARLDWIVEG